MLSAVACGGLDNKLTVFPLALEDDSQSKKKVQRWCFWICADEFDDHRDFELMMIMIILMVYLVVVDDDTHDDY